MLSKTLSECVHSFVKEFILTNGIQLELSLLHLEVSVLAWLWLIVGVVPFHLDSSGGFCYLLPFEPCAGVSVPSRGEGTRG